LAVVDLGVLPYAEALVRQRRLREEVITRAAPDTLLLLEHPPVFTCGRGASPDEFLVPPDTLRERGFEVVDIERGGKTTYHGPGQLVGYPVLDIRARGIGVREYVARLEQCLIDTLAGWGLSAGRRPGYPGVWPGGRKIAALGVHVKQGVTLHGFALNLDPDLSHFGFIVPCGIQDAAVTSVKAELGWAPSMGEAKLAVAFHLQRLLGQTPAR
jgi:lipoate-protein ligase B